jgi:hypothetical protein
MRLRPLVFLAAAHVLVTAPALASAGAGSAVAPRLVLVVSVDQMRFDYLTRFEPLFKAGFRRLLERGAVFTNALYRHANSETGPGHAVMLSGRSARRCGIVANDWYDSGTGRWVNVVYDPVHTVVGGKGRGASPANFAGFTVGDLLKKASPASRVVSVAGKDRSAVLMGGRRADAAYWYETATGLFVSSTYYTNELPAWLREWNAPRPADRLRGRAWTRLLDDEAPYLRLAGPDDAAGEFDLVHKTFPHFVLEAPASKFYEEARRTPFMDELILDVALHAMEAHALGGDDATDLFAVGFSATDVIGHGYGPQSQELMDQLLRLDLTLGRLLDAAEARAGAGRTLLVLTADHGVMPLVESLRAQGLEGRRITPAELHAAVDVALARRFPGQPGLAIWSDDYGDPHVYLDLDAIRRQGLPRAAVERTVEEALLGTGVVERVYTHAQLLGEPPADDPFFSLFRNSFYEPRSPHLTVRLKPYVYVDKRPGGTGHGTAREYDRHVPIVFLGAGIQPGRHDARCGPEDIAPTLARLLGLDLQPQDDARLLTEVLP